MQNNLKNIKIQLEQCLTEGVDIGNIENLMDKNKDVLVNSIDYFVFKSQVYYFKGEYYKAINLLEEGYKYNPYNVAINYNLLINNLAIGNLDRFYENFYSLLRIYSKNEGEKSFEILDYILNTLPNYFEYLSIDFNIQKEILKNLREIIKDMELFLEESNFKNFPCKIGNNTYINEILTQKNRKYCANMYDSGKISLYNLNFNNTQDFRFTNCFEIFEVEHIGRNYNIKAEKDCIVPLLFNELFSTLNIVSDNTEYKLENIYSQRYNYYKLKGNINISCDKDILIGKPLKLNKNSNNKDLVLTLFVDGLSNSFLKSKNLKELMPNTYKFFEKGLICSETYATGEWTLPSVTSICTGKYTNKHHLYHPQRNDSIPDDIDTIFEIYEKNGYNTCFINNDWRITPLYGYLKGVNRYIYQPCIYTDDASILKDAINHLETFKNSNNYMFLSFMELHTISECELMDIYTQTQMTLEEHSRYYIDDKKSVHQDFSTGKTAAYEHKIKILDNILSALYNYLENNFDLENCVISLISDHGQSFLQRDKNIELNSDRIEVPLMIRSKNIKQGFCDEIIQNTDYLSIMTKLSNIDINLDNTDSILPKFLDGTGREYSYSESIYPNATYKAAINTINYIGYFESKDTINEEAMVSLDEYNFYIYDKKKNVYIEDDDFKNYCVDIVYNHMKYHRIY